MNTNSNTINGKDQAPKNVWLERTVCVIGGALLIGSIFRKKTSGRLLRAAVGSYLTYKGTTGKEPISELMKTSFSPKAVNIRVSMVVNRPRAEVYAAWRRLSNLPLFMKHLVSVEEHDPLHSDWTMRMPGGVGSFRWKSAIVKEREQELLAWKSLPGSSLQNAGKVEFADALGQRGTAVEVILSYRAPMGKVGEEVARVFNKFFKKIVQEDIRNFKKFIETGSPVHEPVGY